MNAALCSEIGGGAFPTPAQVVAAGVAALQSRCGVGYRGKTIYGLAQQACSFCTTLPRTTRPSLNSSYHMACHLVPCMHSQHQLAGQTQMHLGGRLVGIL